ncbi:molybdopterin converting factor subunit 1 [Bacillus tianshenii]|nr:molybdopterin converting factor subunit 1 [Bacillus tianshenii]
MIQLYYFASLREKTGKQSEEIPFQSLTVQEALNWLHNSYPTISTKHLMVAINEEYATKQEMIQQGDTVAFIPPVSGG